MIVGAECVRGEGWEIWRGDALEVLPTIRAGSVDAVVTDPPYNVDLDYDSINDKRTDYALWCAQWFGHLRRISPIIAISIGQANVATWAMIEPPTWWLSWWKPASMGRCVVGFNNWEPVALYGKPIKAICDVIRAPVLPDPALNGHPCPKPLAWAKKQIEMLTEPGDLVLDPFMGSGTTGVAALQTGRRYIGIEISANYITIAHRRIEDASRAAAKLPKQLAGRDEDWAGLGMFATGDN